MKLEYESNIWILQQAHDLEWQKQNVALFS